MACSVKLGKALFVEGKMFDLQENLREVSCSVIAVLFTAVFLLSRRRKKRLSLTEPKTDEPKDESELAEEAEAEGGAVERRVVADGERNAFARGGGFRTMIRNRDPLGFQLRNEPGDLFHFI